MGSAFRLLLYPWIYVANHTAEGAWDEQFIEKNHGTAADEAALGVEEREILSRERNNDPHLPLVNFTTQYGYGCFEGVKAFPQPSGDVCFFRVDQNAKRMYNSCAGLRMPLFPEQTFIDAACELVSKNRDLGYAPQFQPQWIEEKYLNGEAVYVRPFTYSEPGIGLEMTRHPSVVIVSTTVGSYLDLNNPLTAITTDMIRATPNGTGWMKCTSNYVIPILARDEVRKRGYAEPIFLDSVNHEFIEECASCNIFFKLKSGALVTPALNGCILPGITRASVIDLARDAGVTVEERPISIYEALSEADECFVTGTAVGVSQLTAITHGDKTTTMNGGGIGELTLHLRDTLKGIQYGAIEDRKGWMMKLRRHR